MKYNILNFCLIILFFLNGCNHKFHNKNEEIEDYECLEISEKVDLFLGNPTDIIKTGNYIVVLDMYKNNFLTIVDLNNNTHVRTGSIGKGQGELIMPFKLANTKNRSIFHVYDIGNKSIFAFNIDSCIQKNVYQPLKIDLALKDYFNVIEIGTKKFIGIGSFESGHYAYSTEDTVSYLYNYPIEKQHQGEENIFACLAYQGLLSYNYAQNKLFYSSSNGTFHEILNFKDNSFELHYSNHELFPTYSPERIGTGYSSALSHDNLFGTLSISSTDEDVYLLRSEKTYKEDKEQYFLGKKITVFNWEGKKVRKYLVKEDLSEIVCDNNGKYLYAIAIRNVPELLKYEIK